MSQHLTHASTDASRVSTRRGEWVGQMTNLTLAELEVDLERLHDGWPQSTYQARAAVATSLIDGAAERLGQLGAA